MSDVRQSAKAVEDASAAITRASWWVRLLTLLTCIATLVVVLVYFEINNRQANDQRARIQKEVVATNFLVQRVIDATDPKSQLSQQADVRQAIVVKGLILCLENHEDRLAALLAHAGPPKVMKGCP